MLADRTFGFRVPMGFRILVLTNLAVPLVWITSLVLTGASPLPSPASMRAGATGFWVIAGFAVLGCACTARLVWRQLVCCRLVREGQVDVTQVGIVLSNWAGHSEGILWDEIEELRIPTLGHAMTYWALGLDIRGAGKRLRISSFVEEKRLLRELIVQRAGLSEKGHTYLTTRFMRSGGDCG